MFVDSKELRERDDQQAPLAHRTDRIALRNESQHPIVYTDGDPLLTLAATEEEASENPFKEGVAEIRHQQYGVDADSFETSETAIREILDRFGGDTGRRFYYAVAGERAQVGGNGLDDFFEVIDNYRRIYRDLDEQLDEPGRHQQAGFPADRMSVQAVGMTYLEEGGTWLRFETRFFETPDEHLYHTTSMWLTTIEQHGPFTTIWLQDKLDHSAIGSPSGVVRDHVTPQANLNLGFEPLSEVKAHRLLGHSGDVEGNDKRAPSNAVECITCPNPYYRADTDDRNEQYERLDEAGVTRPVLPGLVSVDRIPLRPESGSHGIDEDCFIQSQFRITQFGVSSEPGASGVTLLSGETTPLAEDGYSEIQRQITKRRRENESGASKFLGRFRS